MGPSTLRWQVLRDFVGSVFGFCLVSLGWMFGYSVWFSWSLGLEFCLVWCPLGPDPVSQDVCLSSLFLWLFGLFADDVFFSLSLSLRRWGNPNPFGVWVSPCVLFFVHADFFINPYFLLDIYPRSPARLVFFFRRSRWVVVGIIGYRPLSLLVGINCMQIAVTQRGWPTRRRPHSWLWLCFVFWGVWARSGVPDVPSWAACAPPHLLPQSPKKGAERGGGGADRTVMQMLLGRLGGPYCHVNACSLCPFSKGEMLSVFSFLCFLCLVRCLLPFFAVLLF